MVLRVMVPGDDFLRIYRLKTTVISNAISNQCILHTNIRPLHLEALDELQIGLN